MSKKKKVVLDAQAREFVVRLRTYFEREQVNGGPLLPVSSVLERVADALEIGRNTVTRITKEKFGASGMEDNELKTPSKKRKRKAFVTDVDSATADAIRNHINGYFKRKESPTLAKLVASLKSEGLFKGSITSLAIVLKQIGYKNGIKENIEVSKGQTSSMEQKYNNNIKNEIYFDDTLRIDEPDHSSRSQIKELNSKENEEINPESHGNRSSNGFDTPNTIPAFKSEIDENTNAKMIKKEIKEEIEISIDNFDAYDDINGSFDLMDMSAYY